MEKDFNEYIKEEAAKFRATEAYKQLDDEFGIERRRIERELRSNYILVDENLFDSYYMILNCSDKDIELLTYEFEKEEIYFYVFKNKDNYSVFLFFDSEVGSLDRLKILELINDSLNIDVTLGLSDNKLITFLLEQEFFPVDALDLQTILCNSIKVTEKDNKLKNYKIHKSEMRLLRI